MTFFDTKSSDRENSLAGFCTSRLSAVLVSSVLGLCLSGPVAAEDTPALVTEAEFSDTDEDEEAAPTGDDQDGGGSGASGQKTESSVTRESSGTAESRESVARNNLFFLSLGGASLPYTLNYERILGSWTVGGGMGFWTVGELASGLNLRAGASLSVWPTGRHNLLIAAGAIVHVYDCRCYGGSCDGGSCSQKYDRGVYGGIAYEYRRSTLFRFGIDVISIPGSEGWFKVFGIPLFVFPGVSIGFVF